MTDPTREPGAYLVLARRLRPQRFEAVLGQEHVTESLKSALSSGRLAHAYLFCGARGVGKTTVARILARALNCEHYPAPEPCGECDACRQVAEGSSVDFLEIDGASNRGINEIRELREGVKYLPASGRYKVYLIDEVHMLTEPAFNALLKTLEEPPAHVLFIFATTAPQKVPSTILSRCQRYDFRRLPEPMIAAELERICRSEGRELLPEAAAIVAREAEGSMRDSLSLLERVLAACPADEPMGPERVASALGLIDRGLVSDAFAAIASHDCVRLLSVAAEVHAFGQDAQQFCQLLLQRVRDVLAARVLAGRPEAEVRRLVRATPEELAALEAHARGLSQETLKLYFDILMEGVNRIKRAGNPRLALEMTLLGAATLEPAVPLDDILSRLAALEERLAERAEARGAGAADAGQPSLFGSPAKTEPVRQTASEPAARPVKAAPGAPAPEPAAKAAADAEPAGNEPPESEPPVAEPEEPVAGPPAPAPAGAGSDGALERVLAWAGDNDGILFAALSNGATIDDGVLQLAPRGYFKADDLERRAAACIQALGLELEARVAGKGAAAGRPRATRQDLYETFSQDILGEGSLNDEAAPRGAGKPRAAKQ